MSEDKDKITSAPHKGVPGFDPEARSDRFTQEDRDRELERVRKLTEEARVESDSSVRSGADYFRGREFPTDVLAPTGVAYYRRIEDIPTESFRNRNAPLKVEKYEDKASVALQVCPPMEGESPDASFKFVGERGLYVRVIRVDESTHDGKVFKTSVTRWIPFNEEATVAKLKDVRRL